MDAAQLFLFVPIPAKAKKLGLLSIYKFSLLWGIIMGPFEFRKMSKYDKV
jgi:hypothetical protein